MSFPCYPEYKETQNKWLRKIPKNWELVRLKNVISKKITDGPHTTPIFLEEGVPFLSVDGIQNGELVFDSCRYVSFEDHTEFQKKAHPLKNNLLMGKAASTGKIARVKVDFEFSIWSPLALIKVNPENYNPVFLEYVLKAPRAQAEIDVLCTANTQKNISMDDIPKITLTKPSLTEQEAIAKFLDYETAKIDALIDEQEKLIDLLKIKLDALVLTSFKSIDTTLLRLTHVAEVIERPVVQKNGELYEPLGLYNRGRGLFHKDLRSTDEMGDSNFFWIEEGDLIFSGQFAWEGAVAIAYAEEEGCVVSHRYPVLRGRNGVAITEYLYALFTTSHGEFLLNECSIGAAGRNRPLNMNLLLKEKIPVPNINLQERIASMVRERRHLLMEVSRQRDLLLERRSTLISSAVTGQIDVRNAVIGKETV